MLYYIRSLAELSIEEKAFLIHHLLPEEIGRFLSHLEKFSQSIVDTAELTKTKWIGTNMSINAQQWIEIAAQVVTILTNHRKQLMVEPDFFANQLFAGSALILTVNYLPLYCSICPYRFRDGVKFLFDLKPNTRLPFMDNE